MKTIKVTKDGRISLSKFKDFVDVTKVYYYKIEPVEYPLGAFSIKFYNKKKRLLKVNWNNEKD